ncbi:CidA/LrgA family protein [Bacillus massilinigeriensis]|uniref:CidA/LrgA family protein n=1 Tax=Bacillus massilionigeriensis TaxID=1805475 RepID=UPI00096AD9BC|nr:CidA/LrgA family protein [Bacillus massilionigeriensis]
MKIIRIILQIFFLFIISFIGEWLHKQLHIPLPGSIIGFILLLICLWSKIIPEKWVEDGAGFILAFLPLFFIPASVGIMNHPSLLSLQGGLLILIVIASTIITMIAAGKTSQFLERKALKRREELECSKNFTHS